MKSNGIKLGNVKAHIQIYETKHKYWIWNTGKTVKMCVCSCVCVCIYTHTRTHTHTTVNNSVFGRSIISARKCS